MLIFVFPSFQPKTPSALDMVKIWFKVTKPSSRWSKVLLGEGDHDVDDLKRTIINQATMLKGYSTERIFIKAKKDKDAEWRYATVLEEDVTLTSVFEEYGTPSNSPASDQSIWLIVVPMD